MKILSIVILSLFFITQSYATFSQGLVGVYELESTGVQSEKGCWSKLLVLATVTDTRKLVSLSVENWDKFLVHRKQASDFINFSNINSWPDQVSMTDGQLPEVRIKNTFNASTQTFYSERATCDGYWGIGFGDCDRKFYQSTFQAKFTAAQNAERAKVQFVVKGSFGSRFNANRYAAKGTICNYSKLTDERL